MPDSREPAPIVRRAVISVDAVRRQRLLHLLDYIEHRHHAIDAEMYRIDLGEVAALKGLFTLDDDAAEIRISFTHEDLVVLITIVDAADTYSNRYGGTGISGVSQPELEGLRHWVTEAEQWFIVPLENE